jgi:hypothetical protein
MRQREFMELLSSATVAIVSPRIALGQQTDRVSRVGVLMGFPENDPESQRRVKAFQQGLQK